MDFDEYSYRATNDKFNGQIPIPKTYKEAINDPKYGPKWHEVIKLEFNNLIQFNT